MLNVLSLVALLLKMSQYNFFHQIHGDDITRMPHDIFLCHMSLLSISQLWLMTCHCCNDYH